MQLYAENRRKKDNFATCNVWLSNAERKGARVAEEARLESV